MDIPLGARPSGRFLRFCGGSEVVAELGLDATFWFRSSARSSVSSCCRRAGACTSALVVDCGRLLGDFGGDAGLTGDMVRERGFA